MSDSSLKYKGTQIALDLKLMLFKRESDNKWMRLPSPKYVVLTQRKMQQSAGLRGAQMTHKFQTFCVYIKAGNLNILAYQGRRDKVMEEGEKLSKFLNVKVHDIFPRDKDGNVVDDDFGDTDLNYFVIFLVALVIIVILVGFLSLL